MSYIRIRNFWEYQNADAWKKALAAKKSERRHPTWCKLSVVRDDGMDKLPLPTRLLFFELLRLAVEYTNVIPNDKQMISRRIAVAPNVVEKGCGELLKGRWIQVTKHSRPSREFLETFATRSRSKKLEEEPPKPPKLTVVENDDGRRLRELLAETERSLGMPS